MAFEGPFEDQQLIRDRYGNYSDAVFQSDPDLWLANWTEDCIWTIAGAELQGKAALRATWDKLWEAMSKLAFFSEIGAIEVNGDRAIARCYCREIMLLKNNDVRKVVGAYDDKLVRQNGVWLFARRDHRVLMFEAGGAPA